MAAAGRAGVDVACLVLPFLRFTFCQHRLPATSSVLLRFTGSHYCCCSPHCRLVPYLGVLTFSRLLRFDARPRTHRIQAASAGDKQAGWFCCSAFPLAFGGSGACRHHRCPNRGSKRRFRTFVAFWFIAHGLPAPAVTVLGIQFDISAGGIA